MTATSTHSHAICQERDSSSDPFSSPSTHSHALCQERDSSSDPFPHFPPAEQVASLRSPAGSPNQRSGTGSSLLRTPPTPAAARAASPFAGVVPPVESWLLTMTGLPAYPRFTSRHVAHADPAGPLSIPATVGLGIDSAAFTQSRGARLPGVLFRGSLMWFIFIATCRFDSMPAPHPASRRRSWHGLRC
jgi:hypothetical protein